MNQEDRIRQVAHHIWELEGRPHGRHDEHWQRACTDVAREEQRTAPGGRPGAALSDPTGVQTSDATNNGPPDMVGVDDLAAKADRLTFGSGHPTGKLLKRPPL